MVGNALSELLDLTGIGFEVRECELLRLVLELKLGIGAGDGESQQWCDGVREVRDALFREVSP